MKTYDVIVIGLGAMGSATLYQLSKENKNVLGIDKFEPPHIFGSSHGDTRITRQAIGEGTHYTPYVLRANQIWNEIEELSGESLYHKVGGLIISSVDVTVKNHVDEFFENTVESAKKHNIKHELLTAEEIKERFPVFKVEKNETGYFEPEAGYLIPEKCIKTQLNLAQKNGAGIHQNEELIKYTKNLDTGLIEVLTNKGTYITKKLVLSSGSYLNKFLPQKYQDIFKIYRQVLYWFDIENSYEKYSPETFPIFIWELKGNKKHGTYGFPAIDGATGGLKVATEQYHTSTTPEEISRNVTQEEKDDMFANFVEPYFSDIKNNCIRAEACMYTVTPDSEFVIDYHPTISEVVIVSPCSGHGFKHSAAIGEVVSQMVLDKELSLDISNFKLNRFE